MERERWGELYANEDFYDDVLTFQKLDKQRVIAARRLELQFFKKMGVYEKVPRSIAKGKKVISIIWIDTNKGDLASPDYRSRLVGKEIKTDSRLDLFSATPPLEVLKMLMSVCAQGQGGEEPFK